MRSLPVLLLVTLWIGCRPANRADDVVDAPAPDACVGLNCKVVDCPKTGRSPTSVSGTVFAPNGKLPLFGAAVYVPASDPGFFTDGAQCTRCLDQVPGGSVAQTISGPDGTFKLEGVPSGEKIPLVIMIGKWRRQLTIPVVTECADTPLPATATSLPRNKLQGDMPKIAMVTGNCDALECLARKLGIDDSEFTPDTGNGRVHLFASNGASKTLSGLPFSPAMSLWGSLDKLKQYDLAMFSCECSQRANEKPQAAMDALKAYADLGGRVFLSHFHGVWISGEDNVPTHAPAVWPTIASCNDNLSPGNTGVIDQDPNHNPRGTAFASWMTNVMGASAQGQFPITDSRGTCSTLDFNKADRWVYTTNNVVQNFQFTTPNEEMDENKRCGKVVFSDMHVASGSTSSPTKPFPEGCSPADMTPQEKALAFMFFDIASCLGPIY